MRHGISGRKFGRRTEHRQAMLSNLACSLIEHEQIKTTLPKAKDLRPYVEKLITLGCRGDLHARRQAIAKLHSKDIVSKLISDLGPRFKERPGGYTRIIKAGHRSGDNAPMAYIQLVDFEYTEPEIVEEDAEATEAAPIAEEPKEEKKAAKKATEKKPAAKKTSAKKTDSKEKAEPKKAASKPKAKKSDEKK